MILSCVLALMLAAPVTSTVRIVDTEGRAFCYEVDPPLPVETPDPLLLVHQEGRFTVVMGETVAEIIRIIPCPDDQVKGDP